VSKPQLQVYLDEFIFRHNLWVIKTRSRPSAFRWRRQFTAALARRN
jgi:hypothetical protein